MTAGEIAVLLPALDEAGNVEHVVSGFQATADRIVVVDNGSTDATAERARAAGAEVVLEPRRGYGAACLAGLDHLSEDPPEVVVFADCDGTQDPSELPHLVGPILAGQADLVLGYRKDPGAIPVKNRVARWVYCTLLLVLYGQRVRDVPPYRAARWRTLGTLELSQPTVGFPVETVAMACRRGARISEVPVAHRERYRGRSKVGTTPLEVLQIAWIMTTTLIRLRFRRLAA